MSTFTRGATVAISVTFRDAAGAVTHPTAASAYLSFMSVAMVLTSATVTLTKVGDNWTATWDSRVAAAGVVHGHIRSATPLPLSASDFNFVLEANPSNPSS